MRCVVGSTVDSALAAQPLTAPKGQHSERKHVDQNVRRCTVRGSQMIFSKGCKTPAVTFQLVRHNEELSIGGQHPAGLAVACGLPHELRLSVGDVERLHNPGRAHVEMAAGLQMNLQVRRLVSSPPTRVNRLKAITTPMC